MRQNNSRNTQNNKTKNLISGQSGINLIDSFKIEDLPSKIASTVSNEIIEEKFSEKYFCEVPLKIIEAIAVQTILEDTNAAIPF